MIDKVANIAALVIYLAMLTVVVGNPRTVSLVSALGNLFTGSLKTAMGR